MAEIDDIWTCQKHPSHRHRTGVCPTCLRDRLISLCPNCANSLPCPCFPSSTTDSSSSSSSFSRFSLDVPSSSIGAVGRIASLIDSEPSFHRSRSVISVGDGSRHVPSRRRITTSLLGSVFGIFKSEVKVKTTSLADEEERMGMGLMRSKSVSVWRSSESGKGLKSSGGYKGWHFPSPMKVFRQSKPRSPLYRG